VIAFQNGLGWRPADLAVDAMDAARRQLFRQICRVRMLRRLVVQERARLLAMQAFALIAALVLALRWPLVSLWIGAALFGVPHVLAGFRAVAVTRGVSRATVLLSLAGAGVGAAQLLGVGDAALKAFTLLFATAAGVELIAARRGRGLWRSVMALVCLAAAAGAAFSSPRLAALVLVHLHGVGSLAFFAIVARRRRLPFGLFTVTAAGVMAAAALGALDGAMAQTLVAPRGAATSIVQEAIGVAGRSVSAAVFHRGLFLYAFGQSLHFAVWLRLMPEVDRASRVPKPLHRALADFRRDFGRWAWLLLVLAAGSIVMLFAGGGPAREAYFALTYFHVGLEGAALARLLAARQGSVSCSVASRELCV
jgi:hypothetical protein